MKIAWGLYGWLILFALSFKDMKNRNTPESFFCSRSSGFGPIVILWSVLGGRPKIVRILLSKPDCSADHHVSVLFPDSTASSCPEVDAVAGELEAFLSGEDIRFSLQMVCMDLCPEFQRRVLLAEREIPRGAVSTYTRIARHLNNPNGARAAGNALAKNPLPIIIPCHRVVRTDRSLGGYQGGLEMKRSLLEMEGIEFDGTARVITKDLYY